MPIIEVPFVHGMEAIPPGARSQRLFGVFDRVAVALPGADGVPVAVRLVSGAACTLRHASVEHAVGNFLSIGHTIDYAGWRGALWRPVHYFPADKPYPSDPVFATLDAMASAEQTWLTCVAGNRHRNRERLPSSASQTPFLSLRPNPPGRYREAYASNSRFRDVSWSDREATIARMIVEISRDFAVLNGVLHARTQGPVWSRISVEQGTHIFDPYPDGVPSTINECAVVSARADLVAIEASVDGCPVATHGSIEVVDAELYDECAPSLETMVLASAARVALESRWFGSTWEAPPQILGPLGRLSEAFPDRIFLDVVRPDAVASDLRAIDQALPFNRIDSQGCKETTPSPLGYHIEWLERLRGPSAFLAPGP